MRVIHNKVYLFIGMLALISVAIVIPSTRSITASNQFTGSKFVPEWAEFVPTGNMNVARRGILLRSVRLENENVLLAGGWDGINCVTSSELYNPSTGAWSTTGNMNVGRCSHSMTVLQDGMVLVAGGSNASLGQLTSAEIYNPSSGTWNLTGSMADVRDAHTATLLNDGSVLVAGGFFGTGKLGKSELFNQSTGQWTPTDEFSSFRSSHRATLLDNNKVLIFGGSVESPPEITELYDPLVSLWFTTGSMSTGRFGNTGTLLSNGKVLAAGGRIYNVWLSSAEIFNPSSGSWSATGNMNYPHQFHTATLLGYGEVLVAGGQIENVSQSISELFNPSKGTWRITASMNESRQEHTAILLNDTHVLVAGGRSSTTSLNTAEIGTFVPANTFTGTLILPSGWLTQTEIAVQLSGETSDTPLEDGSISNDKLTWGEWTDLTSDVITTTTWDVGSDGVDLPIYLRLRDVYSQTAVVISGTIDVDTNAPVVSLDSLSTYQANATFPVSWVGTDITSGIKEYDVQYKDGPGAWTDWLTRTIDTAADFTGLDNHTYSFSLRASDFAGNLSEYSNDIIQTILDLSPPIATTFTINGGAFSTTSPIVSLTLSGTDATSGITSMAFSNDGASWSTWQTYNTSAGWTIQGGDGEKTVFLHLQDEVNHVSDIVSDTIHLDTTTDGEFGVLINDGELFTNQVTVTLTIGAPSLIAEMKLSNNGGFPGVSWESYRTYKPWVITELGSHLIPRIIYVKYKDVLGSISATYQDDIIFDDEPPTGSVLIKNRSDQNMVESDTRALILSASDDVSGVGSMQICSIDNFSGAYWETFTTTREWEMLGGETVYVRFRDNAGNISETYQTVSLYENFLPIIIR